MTNQRHCVQTLMSGITFGSVGDVIAVGQVAWALAQALTDSRGSSKEYQGLVKELKAFDQALLQVSQRALDWRPIY